jgi:hypothetical protein
LKLFRNNRPTPALLISMLALVLALGGTAIAFNPTKANVKKIAKKQADKRLKANVAGSHVNIADTATNATNATNADTVDGKHAEQLESKGFNSQSETPAPLDAAATSTIIAIDLPAGRFFASGQFSINNNGGAAIGNDAYTCAIQGGASSHTIDGQGLAANGAVGDRENYSLNLVLTLAAPGQVLMNCTMPAGWTGNAIDPSLSAVSLQP